MIPKYMSRPPVFSFDTVTSYGVQLPLLAEVLMPLGERPGVPQENAVGFVDLPVLFVCGREDPYLLCGRDYSKVGSGELVMDGGYEYLEVGCEHNVLSLGCGGAEVMEATGAWVERWEDATRSPTAAPTAAPTEAPTEAPTSAAALLSGSGAAAGAKAGASLLAFAVAIYNL
jgi:hypothetical protein